MIKYITSVNGDGYVSHILAANDKNVTVIFVPEKKSSYSDRIDMAHYKYGNITVNDSMTVSSSNSHFAEILLAVELVNVIKEFNQGDSK